MRNAFALKKCGPTLMKVMRAMETSDSQVARPAGSLKNNRKRSHPKGTGVRTQRDQLCTKALVSKEGMILNITFFGVLGLVF